MVQLKSKRELEIMRASCRIVVSVLQELANNTEKGVRLCDLNDLAEERCRALGGKPAFKGYRGFPAALCASVNEQIVHGIPDKRRLKEGDIVGYDFGVLLDGFFGDSAVTVPVGKVSEAAMQLMRVTKRALYAAIDAARPGSSLRDLAAAIESTVGPFHYGIVREFVGHGIGSSLHEDPQIPNYLAGATHFKLKPGMTICIEPMINEGKPGVNVLKDKWTAVTEDGKLSAHYEHTVLITEAGPEILTDWEGKPYAYQID